MTGRCPGPVVAIGPPSRVNISHPESGSTGPAPAVVLPGQVPIRAKALMGTAPVARRLAPGK